MNSRKPARRVPSALVERLLALTLAALEDLYLAGELDHDELQTDPIGALTNWDRVEVRRLDEGPSQQAAATTTQDCNVAGTYYDATASNLPVIAIAESRSTGRNAFTALHELGHHLQRTTDELADELADLDRDSSFLVEDAVCDRFAAYVLIPSGEANAVFGAGNPSAADVVALASRTVASRAAVCVRAAQHLKVPGIVVLLDKDDCVEFSAARDVPPLRRGLSQEASPLVRKARQRIADGDHSFRIADDDFHLRYRDRIEGDALYGQIADIGNGYLVLVAVLERPSWKEGFTLPKKSTGPSTKSRICPHTECGEIFYTWSPPHDVCGEPHCPACRRCSCSVSHVKERTCKACTMVQPAHLFAGDGDVCDDCA